MYTIIMRDDKSLCKTVSSTIYQREKLADTFRFLLPPTHEGLDLSLFTVTLKYIDQGNVAHSEILTLSEELYKNKLCYHLPIDTNLTRFAGDITIRLTLNWIDWENRKQHVLHSGEAVITVSPLSDYYNFVSDESLEIIDQLIGNLEAKIKATEKIAEIYDSEKADSLSYENNELQLVANGNKIGEKVTIDSCSCSDNDIFKEGIPVVDFSDIGSDTDDKEDGDTPSDEYRDVVEF